MVAKTELLASTDPDRSQGLPCPGKSASGANARLFPSLRDALRARLLRAGVAAAILLAPALSAPDPAGAAQDEPCWSVTEASPGRVRVRVEIGEPRWIPGAGGGSLLVPGFFGEAAVLGAWFPIVSLPTALPPDGGCSVEVSVEGLRPVGKRLDQLIRADSAIQPGEPENKGGTAGVVSESPEGGHSPWRAADPDGFVETGSPQWAGEVRLLPLRVFPFRPDAAGWLHGAQAIEIVITFTPGAAQGRGEPAGMGAGRSESGPVAGMAALARDIVINPAQVGAWLRPAPALPKLAREGDSFATATSPWLRIEVRQRGLYVLTAADLEDAGVTPSEVDLAQLRLFAASPGAVPESLAYAELPSWMEPCALHLEDDGDGIWDDETRLYFLGQGPDGWYDDLDLTPPSAEDRYYTHPHAAAFHYWLCWGGAFATPPVWIEERDAQPQGGPLLQVGTAHVHVDPNLFQDLRPRQRGLEWPRFYALSVRASTANLGASLWAALPAEPVAGPPATVRAALWGKTWGNPDGYDHHAVVLVNGDTLGVASWEGLKRAVISDSLEEVSTENLVALYVPQRYRALGEAITDLVYLDWAEFDYTRFLDASEDSLDFWVSREAAAGHTIRVTGLDSADGWLLLDAGSFRRPVALAPVISAQGGAYVADFHLEPEEAESHLVLLQRSRAATPHAVTRVVAEGGGWLRERSAAVDYLIVTAPELSAPAAALAGHRAGHFHGAAGDTLRSAAVSVVTTQAVFDEFSWGQHDPAALRNFIAFARDAWRGGQEGAQLSHALLLGDGSQDPRNYLQGSATELVPAAFMYTWQYQTWTDWDPAYLGDDWFALLDGPDDRRVDLHLGRLPVSTATQAWGVVRKIIDYETSASLGDWRSRLVFVADDVCQGIDADDLGYTHMIQTERLCRAAVPGDARLEKIFLYEYGSECRYDRKPQATQDLLAAIEEGALLVNYVGHGSDVQLADERLLDQSSIASLANTGKPFLLITASCAVGRFAGEEAGLAVQAVRLAERGALATLSATATASSWINFDLNRFMLQELFPEGSLCASRALGPALSAAKWASLDENDHRYCLLGDPDSRFAAPEQRVRLWIEGVPGVSAGADTLLRGGGAVLAGEVLDASGMPGLYEGEADILVLDSDILREPPSEGWESTDYQLPGARIFSGQVPVSEGRFSCPFFVPTALRVGTRGPARAYAYARQADEGSPVGEAGGDGIGALGDLFIPEIRLTSTDSLGPEIHLAWENPEAIQAGSVLWATLGDSSGIYVAALLPSRSVVLTIADADERVLVAEDLAASVSFGGDYRSGWLRYAIPEGLPAGEPLTLALEASDNLGRRTREELAFQLTGAGGAADALLGMVFNLPNPMETETRFFCELAREADLEIVLYTVSGKKIATLPGGRFTPGRAGQVGIPWDGRDGDGDPVANGLYFYRLLAREPDGSSAERIERLVVLR